MMSHHRLVTYSSCVLFLSLFLSCSSSSSPIGDSTFAKGVSHVENLNTQFVPASMAVIGLLNGDTTTSNYCSLVENDLTACQPILMRRYYTDAASNLKKMLELAQKVGAAAGELSITSSAKTVALSGVEGIDQISYKKSKDELTVVGLKSSVANFLVSVSGSSGKTVELRTQNSSSGEEFQLELSYLGENDWSATLFQVDAPCVDSDVRKPEKVKIRVTRKNDLWTGKVMSYLPRWNFAERNPLACSAVASNTVSRQFYFDFVADKSATKGKVFVFALNPNNFQEGSYETSYGIPAACENEDGVVCFSTKPKNPFCNLATSLAVSFNDDTCAASSTNVSSGAFGAFADWDEPSSFRLQSISFPSTSDL